MKKFKRQLKTEAEIFTPDPLKKIKLAAQSENLLPDEYVNAGNTAVKFRPKLVGILSSLAAGALCTALILTFTLRPDKPFTPTPVSLSADDVYGMGAVSAARLLASMPETSIGLLSQTDELQIKKEAEKFNQYFTALDSFWGDDIVTTATVKNTDADYPFEIKMTVMGIGFDGTANNYTMYYTETLHKSEDDEDEIEKEYKLVGVMIIDGNEYAVEGERSEESEKDENETELKIRAYADVADRRSYVQMEQEYSVENGKTQTEYVYSVYADGKLIEETAVEFEAKNKNGKVQTEYSIEFRKGKSKGKYEIERRSDKTAVEYKIDGENGEFFIREVTGNGKKLYEYTFSDGSALTFR